MSAVDVLHHVTSSLMFNEVNWPGKCLLSRADGIYLGEFDQSCIVMMYGKVKFLSIIVDKNAKLTYSFFGSNYSTYVRKKKRVVTYIIQMLANL